MKKIILAVTMIFCVALLAKTPGKINIDEKTFHYYIYKNMGIWVNEESLYKIFKFDNKNGTITRNPEAKSRFDYSILNLKGIFFSYISKLSGVKYGYSDDIVSDGCVDKNGYENPWCVAYCMIHPAKARLKKYDKAFQKVFGIGLYNKIRIFSFEDRNYLVYYNAAAIEKAFDMIYKSPQQKISGIRYQKYYDVIFKDWFTHRVIFAHAMLGNKDRFINLCSEYEKKLNEDPEFNSRELVEPPAEALQIRLKIPQNDSCERFAGMLVRRQIDGSLPTVLKCLDKIISDYDKDLHAKYDFSKLGY